MGAFNLDFNTPGSPMMPGRVSTGQMPSGFNLDFSQYRPGSPSSMMQGQGFNPSAMAAGEESGGMWENFLGDEGWGNLALGGINAGINGYMGFKQLGLAKDQLDFQKKTFEKNYNAQKQRTNTQLKDRQKRRYAENPDHYVSPDEYMAQNGVQ